nr:hypothetical protein [uncultured Albidiferax sp.]
MNSGQLVVAYHGCDVTLRDALVSGRTAHLLHSNNKYDWLGSGAYFFENDFERALLFAQNAHAHPAKRYTAIPIATPAVVGAILCISRCLDMTTQDGIREYTHALKPLLQGFAEKNTPPPTNHAASLDDTEVILRELDRSVFEFIHQARESRPELPNFQAVRGAFQQGKALSDASGFKENTHIQIALRDDSCVLGWFLPPGLQLLTAEQLQEAHKRLAQQKSAGKPRVRANSPAR